MIKFAGKPKAVYSEEMIREKVGELAARLTADYSDKNPVLLGVLTGSFIFLADLCRQLKFACEIDFVRMDSYGKHTTSSGKPKLTMSPKLDLSDRYVIIVDEIVDTGLTLGELVEGVAALGAREVKVCALVDKRARRRVDIQPHYAGFTIEEGFLVGYGLDAAERRRNLPAIYLLDE